MRNAPYEDARVGSARVRVALRPDPDTRLWWTYVTARFVLGAGPRFELASPGLGRIFRIAAGWRVFALDSPLLNGRFGRIGEDPQAIRRAFTEPVTSALDRLPKVRIYSDGARIELFHPGVFADLLARATAVEVVGGLAQVDAEPAHAALRALPDAIFHAASDDFDHHEPAYAELPALGVRIQLVGERGRQRTRVMRPLASREINVGQLPPAAVERVTALGASDVRCEAGWVIVSFDGVMIDAPRLLAAASTCYALATSVSEGVYR